MLNENQIYEGDNNSKEFLNEIIEKLCISGLPAFHDFSDNIQLSRVIVFNGIRPSIPANVPNLVAELIIKCWNAQPDKRPTSREIYEALNKWNSEISSNKSTEIVTQIRKANEMLKDNMSTTLSYIDTFSDEIYFDPLEIVNLDESQDEQIIINLEEKHAKENSQSLIIVDPFEISNDYNNVVEKNQLIQNQKLAQFDINKQFDCLNKSNMHELAKV
ncbi:13330_t:CDS:2 [Cetraspora pellucida]|uniref:13330_t:CDS:1 n=1 Tax=Cetraspora pellucida TaxID=1433469 RepID=A0A9N9ET00_9GLOM|nr:13330_t:CDS:2 [Cetraspora pellucida]